MRTLSGCVTVSMLAIIGCGSPAPETDSSATEQTAPIAQVRPEPQPFRMSGNQIVTDTFDVRYDVRDNRLTIALDTDLGDPAKLMVGVSRSYWKQGSEEEYSVDYFSEQSTVGAWREPRTIRLDHDAWKREIEQRQRVLAAFGEPFS